MKTCVDIVNKKLKKMRSGFEQKSTNAKNINKTSKEIVLKEGNKVKSQMSPESNKSLAESTSKHAESLEFNDIYKEDLTKIVMELESIANMVNQGKPQNGQGIHAVESFAVSQLETVHMLYKDNIEKKFEPSTLKEPLSQPKKKDGLFEFLTKPQAINQKNRYPIIDALKSDIEKGETDFLYRINLLQSGEEKCQQDTSADKILERLLGTLQSVKGQMPYFKYAYACLEKKLPKLVMVTGNKSLNFNYFFTNFNKAEVEKMTDDQCGDLLKISLEHLKPEKDSITNKMLDHDKKTFINRAIRSYLVRGDHGAIETLLKSTKEYQHNNQSVNPALITRLHLMDVAKTLNVSVDTTDKLSGNNKSYTSSQVNDSNAKFQNKIIQQVDTQALKAFMDEIQQENFPKDLRIALLNKWLERDVDLDGITSLVQELKDAQEFGAIEKNLMAKIEALGPKDVLNQPALIKKLMQVDEHFNHGGMGQGMVHQHSQSSEAIQKWITYASVHYDADQLSIAKIP